MLAYELSRCIGDPACGHRTYEGHKGTDIAIRYHAAMRHGMDVLAAAGGSVLRVHDGMMDHGGGWETQYCHLRQGGFAVRSGQRVKRGQKLGLVRASGLTAFPHIHITIRWDGQVMAPLTARKRRDRCSKPVRSLWRDPTMARYRVLDLSAGGMANSPVYAISLEQDATGAKTLPGTATALVLWATAFGVAAGDSPTLEITGPRGTLNYRTVQTGKRRQVWRMVYSGRKRQAVPWPPGRYQDRGKLRRRGKQPVDQTRLVLVDVR